jgi:outer membrane protein TolC
LKFTSAICNLQSEIKEAAVMHSKTAWRYALVGLLALAVALAGRAAAQPADLPPVAVEPPAGPHGPHLQPLSLADAIRRSLANVETVQANVTVQRATVAQFEALKEFVPLVNLPQLAVGFRNLSNPGNILIFPDVTDGALLSGRPGLDRAALNRVNLYFPLDPAGQLAALPIAEEGVHVKVLMEQLVRRSQMMLAVQGYYEAKQIPYGIRTARAAAELARQTRELTQRRLAEKQAHEVELSEARVNESKAAVLLADLEKASRIVQRDLAVVLHQSRLLVPQHEPVPIDLDPGYCFNLTDTDAVDLKFVPDFPACREDAMQLAKRQRVEVRLHVTGLKIARLRQDKSLLGLFGMGKLPAELSYKGTTPGNGGVALGAIFGATYGLPVLDVGLWSSIRDARLDVVQSQLELEKALIDVQADAGNAWDRWQQAVLEWRQREAELDLRRELLQRQERLFEQKQVIEIDVLAARVNALQADANRWTAWYNLQLARFNVLRSTEQLLDYVERAGIAHRTAWQKPPPESLLHRWLPWLAEKDVTPSKQEAKHEQR